MLFMLNHSENKQTTIVNSSINSNHSWTTYVQLRLIQVRDSYSLFLLSIPSSMLIRVDFPGQTIFTYIDGLGSIQ